VTRGKRLLRCLRAPDRVPRRMPRTFAGLLGEAAKAVAPIVLALEVALACVFWVLDPSFSVPVWALVASCGLLMMLVLLFAVAAYRAWERGGRLRLPAVLKVARSSGPGVAQFLLEESSAFRPGIEVTFLYLAGDEGMELEMGTGRIVSVQVDGRPLALLEHATLSADLLNPVLEEAKGTARRVRVLPYRRFESDSSRRSKDGRASESEPRVKAKA